MPIPVLTIPPRPPELPTVPPPKEEKPKEPHLRNDAHLSIWIEELSRIIKDAWAGLGRSVVSIESKVNDLFTRVSDTYTWGQRGGLRHEQFVALPLRVVRPETLVEVAVAVETASSSGDVVIDIRKNGVFLAQATVPAGETFAAAAVSLPLAKNDKLAVVVAHEGTDTRDLVVQCRCV